MSAKKKFWLTFGIVFVSLIVLLVLRPEMADATTLVIELSSGETHEINIQDLRRSEGIDFQNLGEESEVVVNLLERFYERYRVSRGDKLIKVFYLHQILEFSRSESIEFTDILFHSADGARILISPQEHKDFLILMALELENGEYSLRLIMPEDNFSQRWLKNVVRIEV
jgi:hypothetical protein